jgi:magnesium-transporting ATPase (P-type)
MLGACLAYHNSTWFCGTALLLVVAPIVEGATIAVLASRHRLLVRLTGALSELARMQTVALEKTGTLTSARLAYHNAWCMLGLSQFFLSFLDKRKRRRFVKTLCTVHLV